MWFPRASPRPRKDDVPSDNGRSVGGSGADIVIGPEGQGVDCDTIDGVSHRDRRSPSPSEPSDEQVDGSWRSLAACVDPRHVAAGNVSSWRGQYASCLSPIAS